VPPEAAKTAASAPLYDDDDDGGIDEDVDNLLEGRLSALGFDHAAVWLERQDAALVEEWLDWIRNLDGKKKNGYRNIVGVLRRGVEEGQRPFANGRTTKMSEEARLHDQVPAEYRDIVKR
jgi:hypothetical protein